MEAQEDVGQQSVSESDSVRHGPTEQEDKDSASAAAVALHVADRCAADSIPDRCSASARRSYLRRVLAEGAHQLAQVTRGDGTLPRRKVRLGVA